jgi:mannose-6-phosphate isomerase-like protein (cupin superfamily)
MQKHISVVLTAVMLAFACTRSIAHTDDTRTGVIPPPKAGTTQGSQVRSAPSQDAPGATPISSMASLPCEAFTNPPQKPHDPAANFFAFDQLEHWYRVPGEFTHRLTGDQYGFETLSLIITETHPGGGPGLHVHDTEEAHVLLEGTAQYRIGDRTFTVRAPYVAKVPAGVPHTFINVDTKPFNLVAVFASKHPSTTRIGPNPLVLEWQSPEGPLPCRTQ